MLRQPIEPGAPKLTAAQRKALKLQGAYMGTMRVLNPARQAQV